MSISPVNCKMPRNLIDRLFCQKKIIDWLNTSPLYEISYFTLSVGEQHGVKQGFLFFGFLLVSYKQENLKSS